MFSMSSDPAKMIDNKVDQSFSTLLSRLSFLKADLIILTLSQVPSGTLQFSTSVEPTAQIIVIIVS